MSPLQPDSSAFVAQTLPGVSRTFALGISLLSQPLRDQVGVAYLLCRVLDTLEDAGGDDREHRIELLRGMAALFGDAAQPGFDGRAAGLAERIAWTFSGRSSASEREERDFQLCADAPRVLAAYLEFAPSSRALIAGPVSEMASGMADTLARESVQPVGNAPFQLQSAEDLRDYCYFVAGTVGKLLTALFAAERPAVAAARAALEADAVSFGLGLQMTNIIRDVTDDLKRGVVYVPAQALSQQGLDVQQAIADPSGMAARGVIAALALGATHELDRAQHYTLTLPPQDTDLRLFCALPLVLALRTLARVTTDAATFDPGAHAKVSRLEVADLYAECAAAAPTNTALGTLFARERAALDGALHASLGSRPSAAAAHAHHP
jgi:farnesyl-diphosphate farnesyltransferase